MRTALASPECPQAQVIRAKISRPPRPLPRASQLQTLNGAPGAAHAKTHAGQGTPYLY